MTEHEHRWSSLGVDAEHLFNGVVVHYNDAEGNRTSVGPPDSKSNATDPALTDSHQSLTAHGARRWGLLRLKSPATLTSAIQIGATWLAEQRRLGRPVYTCVDCGYTTGERPWN